MKSNSHPLAFVLGTVFVTAAAARADHLRNLKLGEPIPPFSLQSLSGEALDNSALEGKVGVLVFLSAEQSSSERAALAAQEVFTKLRREDLKLIYVTADTAQAPYFRQQRDKTRVHEPLGLDFDRRFYGTLGIIVLPTTIGVDKEGKLAFVISGHKSDYPHVLETRLRLALGEIDQVEADRRLAAQTFMRDRPADRAARHRAAAALLCQKGLLADAEKELKSALEVEPGNSDAALDLASLYLRQQRLTEATGLIDGVLTANPAHRRGKMMRGVVLLKTGALDEAEILLREALVLNPDPARTHYYLGVLYEQKGQPEQALIHYREALSRLLDGVAE